MSDKVTTIFRWYFSRNALPYWGILLIDCFILFVAALLVYTLNTGVVSTLAVAGKLVGVIAIYMVFYIIGFRLFHTYSGVIRFSSFIDLQKIAYANIFGLVFSVSVRSIFHLNDILPVRLRDMVYWTILAVLAMWALRVLVKYLYDSIYRQSTASKAYIYGVRQGGVAIAKSLRNQDPARYILSGFLTEEPKMAGLNLMGVRTYLATPETVANMKKQGVEALFVSPLRSESLRENTELTNALIDEGIKIFMVPSEQEWDGKSDISHMTLREVDIEDLLPRETIEVDLAAIADQLRGKKILITGAAGSIGSEIVKQVALFGPAELILIDQAETPMHDVRLHMQKNYPEIEAHTIVADIANRNRMHDIFSRHRPDYVFHAAAYKHVPMMEDNPSESIQNNVEGTRIIADQAVEFGVWKFVMVSTDKAVNPTNVMGASKRICEIYVQSLDKAIKDGRIKAVTQFVTTRFGNVLGSNGSVIPLFREQIRNGGPVTVTHPDIIRYFMLIPEACKLVLEAGVMGHGGEIFVFDMGQPVKIVDLAHRMIKLSGAKVDVVFTGLREGEKLYEEVLNDKETTLPTFNPNIKIAKVREYNYLEVSRMLEELCRLSHTATDMEIVAYMKKIVPEYISRNSIYEVLDKKQPSNG